MCNFCFSSHDSRVHEAHVVSLTQSFVCHVGVRCTVGAQDICPSRGVKLPNFLFTCQRFLTISFQTNTTRIARDVSDIFLPVDKLKFFACVSKRRRIRYVEINFSKVLCSSKLLNSAHHKSRAVKFFLFIVANQEKFPK